MKKSPTATLYVLIGGTLSLLYLAIVPAFDIPRKIIDSVQYGKTGDNGTEGVILLASWVVLAVFVLIFSHGIYKVLSSSRIKNVRKTAKIISITTALAILTLNLVLSFIFGLNHTMKDDL